MGADIVGPQVDQDVARGGADPEVRAVELLGDLRTAIVVRDCAQATRWPSCRGIEAVDR